MTNNVRLPILAVLAVFMVSLVAIAPQQEVGAQGASWECEPGFYQVISGQMAELDPATGHYRQVGADDSNYNAMGHRHEDGFLYAMRGKTLLRIGNNGVAEPVADLDIEMGGGNPYTGDFGDDGLLYIARGSNRWYAVDVTTGEATRMPGLDYPSYTVADIANVNGKFYGVSGRGSLVVFDPVAQKVEVRGVVEGLITSSSKAYGAAWSTAGGNLYVNRNSSELYQITGYSGSNPVATQIGNTVATKSNDGASCRYAMPPEGVPDVDGPESETPASTPEGEQAEEEYVDAVESGDKVVDPEETGEVGSQDDDTQPEDPADENYQAPDAGLGTGASCSPNVNEDRLPRAEVNAADYTEATVLYDGTFGSPDPENWLIQSGSWSFNNGTYEQQNTCGFDYTSLLATPPLANYVFEASFHDLDGVNHGGIVIGQASEESRSGAWLIDLSEDGTVLRWGQYDDKGYYGTDGVVVPVTAPAAGEVVTISARVLDGVVYVSYNGEVMGEIQSTATGHVGLVSSTAAVAFDAVTLTAIPSQAG